MKQSEKPASLLLNGRVYVSGALEETFPSQRCPRNPEAGTLRIHSHLDEEGTKARARGFCKQGYSGLIRASLFDGKQWRKFMLARECQVEQRSFPNFLQRQSKAQSVLRVLGLLKGKTCIYRDGAFAVDHEVAVEVPQPATKAAAELATPLAATAKEASKFHGAGQQATLFPKMHSRPVAPKAKKAVRRKSSPTRHKRSTKRNPHQRELF